jgi:hypothetical protein
VKVIVAGSRWIWDISVVEQAIEESRFEITELVNGSGIDEEEEPRCLLGVDLLALQWAKEHGILPTYFPAEWTRYRKAGLLVEVYPARRRGELGGIT